MQAVQHNSVPNTALLCGVRIEGVTDEKNSLFKENKSRSQI